jgi:hypothetical protein
MPPNTSANPTFPGLPNGTLPGSTNVSKVNVHTLLYPGNTTKVLVHYLPWFDGGNDSGINVGYSNSDPNYINAFFSDLTSRGVDGVMVDWQGQTDQSNTRWLVAQPMIRKYPNLSYAIMLDSNMFNNSSGTNQQKVMDAMAYISAQYFADPQYLKYNGKMVVGDFALTAATGMVLGSPAAVAHSCGSTPRPQMSHLIFLPSLISTAAPLLTPIASQLVEPIRALIVSMRPGMGKCM